MALKTIEQEWQGFASMVIPTSRPGEVQYDEMKKAFFAGAWALRVNLDEIGQPHITEQQGMRFLHAIRVECLAFKSKVMREHGEKN